MILSGTNRKPAHSYGAVAPFDGSPRGCLLRKGFWRAGRWDAAWAGTSSRTRWVIWCLWDSSAAASSVHAAVLPWHHKRQAAHRFYDHLGFERHGYSFLVRL